MKADELAAIRQAINDTSSPYTHQDEDIEEILDLTRSRYLTSGHFLLADAIAISDPTAPTAPTLDDPPTIADAPSAPSITSEPEKMTSLSLQKWQAQVANDKYLSDLDTRKWQAKASDDITKWREKSSNQLNKYSQELTGYRAEMSGVQTAQELRRAQAQIYLDLAKDNVL